MFRLWEESMLTSPEDLQKLLQQKAQTHRNLDEEEKRRMQCAGTAEDFIEIRHDYDEKRLVSVVDGASFTCKEKTPARKAGSDLIKLPTIMYDVRAKDGTWCTLPYPNHSQGCPNFQKGCTKRGDFQDINKPQKNS